MNGVSKASVGIETQAGDALVAGFELHQHFRQFRVAGRACHQAHVRRAVEDLLAFLLGHAADHREHLVLARVRLKCCRRLKTFCSALSRMLQVL